MLGIRKGAHIGADLRNNGRCRSYINARYGTQNTQCLFVLCDLVGQGETGKADRIARRGTQVVQQGQA